MHEDIPGGLRSTSIRWKLIDAQRTRRSNCWLRAGGISIEAQLHHGPGATCAAVVSGVRISCILGAYRAIRDGRLGLARAVVSREGNHPDWYFHPHS